MNHLHDLIKSEFPISKKEIENVSNVIVQLVNDGELNAMNVIINLKFLSDAFNSIRDKLTEPVRTAIEQYGKEVTMKGVKLELAETGVKYDYSNDAHWERLNASLKSAQRLCKDREKYLQGVTHKIVEVDEETGETMEIFPPIKTSKSSFKINIPKD